MWVWAFAAVAIGAEILYGLNMVLTHIRESKEPAKKPNRITPQ